MAAHMRHTSLIIVRATLQTDSRNIILRFKPQRESFAKVHKICQASLHSQCRPSTTVWASHQRNASLLQRSRNFKFHLPASSLVFRCNSSNSPGPNSFNTPDSSGFIQPPDYIPPVPPIPETASATADLAESLNALGEPTLQSLGLGSYWPPGLVQQGLEALHVGLGLPWWASIVAGTLIVRLFMFPIVVKAQRVSINMMNHMPTIQRLQAKFTDARLRGNMMEAMEYGTELGNYMKKNKVNPLAQLFIPMCQMPIFVSVFIGLRGMANLPVESMTHGGCLWFTDLTITQPIYGLPILTALTFWLTVEAGADGMSTSSQTHVMKWFLRAMPVVMLPLIVNFPTAMLVYWFTSNSFSLMQVMFLKIPQVRKYFRIPERIKQPPQAKSQKKGFVEGFRETYSNMKASQQVQERIRIDETAMRKAAQGPLIKTYSYNPKEVKRTDNKSSTNKVIAKSKSS